MRARLFRLRGSRKEKINRTKCLDHSIYVCLSPCHIFLNSKLTTSLRQWGHGLLLQAAYIDSILHPLLMTLVTKDGVFRLLASIISFLKRVGDHTSALYQDHKLLAFICNALEFPTDCPISQWSFSYVEMMKVSGGRRRDDIGFTYRREGS
jgi:hypothetical protein